MEETFVLPKGLRDGLLAYLGTRPYVEVAEAINALAKLESYKTEDEPKDK